MIAANDPACARPLTGRTVLIWLIAFFATISIVNAIMIRAAITTFGGLETGSAYQAGRTFEREIAAARAQDARHWQVKANLRRAGAEALVEIDARDAGGQALAGLAASATLHHPTDARADHVVPLNETAPGRFSGTAATAPGQWDILIELTRGPERVFRSRNRVVLQ
jgi:nitrogen fixation protein FixH